MNGMFDVRTDLAVEIRESFPGDGGEIPGVSLEEIFLEQTGVKVIKVEVLDEDGARIMGKPVGSYITLEAEHMNENDEESHREISAVLAEYVRKLMPKPGETKVLLVGLGNDEATPDSLGPKVISNIQMTRHLYFEYGEKVGDEWGLLSVSGITPGVMAQTGMETAEIIKGVVQETKPDVVIAIDALAARSIYRLGTTIQISDTGIQPGSGVGNHRHSLTEESLGVPVIAIGVPTVVGAATIVHDTMDAMVEVLSRSASTEGVSAFVNEQESAERYQLIRELLEPGLGPMYVTPKDIDESVKRISFTISEGLHMALRR